MYMYSTNISSATCNAYLQTIKLKTKQREYLLYMSTYVALTLYCTYQNWRVMGGGGGWGESVSHSFHLTVLLVTFQDQVLIIRLLNLWS